MQRSTQSSKATTRRPVIMLLGLALWVALILGAVLVSPNGSAAREAGAQTRGYASGAGFSPLETSTSTPTPACSLDWRFVPSAGASTLNGVAVISADDVWAVGPRYLNPGYESVTIHWDGSSWTLVPNPGTGSLRSVAAVSSDDVWAVGDSVTMHWDGASWTSMPAPIYGLTGVAAVSSDDVWAVGAWGGACEEVCNIPSRIIHWDGSSWTQVSSPSYYPGVNQLFDVAAVSANDVWAVGTLDQWTCGDEGCLSGTMTMHWDGSNWSLVDNPGLLYGYECCGSALSGVAAISSNDVWAVGNGGLTMHWDGSTWTEVPAPVGALGGVAALSANDVWAVGGSNGQTAITHWDGFSWALVPSPAAGALCGVAAVSATDVWAVGGTSGAPLTLHYSQDCPLPTFTPTVTRTPTITPTLTNTPVPDFTLSVSPTSLSMGRPGGASYTVTLQSINYGGSVSLSVSGLPSRTEYSFSPNPVTLTRDGAASSVLGISTRLGGGIGTYTLTITATDGVRTRSQTVTLIVNR